MEVHYTILLSERLQFEKASCCMIPTIPNILEKTKLWRQEKNQRFPGISGKGEMHPSSPGVVGH